MTTAARVSNIGVSAGETVTCTFTNHKRGQIVVVEGRHSRTTRRTSRSRPAAASRPASFQLDDDADGTLSNTRTFTDVPPGTGYSLAETVPSGWDQTSATCDDGSPVSNIDVAPGETVTCTFTNRKRGQIVIVKDAQPNDAQDFSFTAGGGLSPASFALDDDSDGTLSNTRTFANVAPGGGYSVVRDGAEPAGTRPSATCDDGSPVSNIDVAAGETVTCTSRTASAAGSWSSRTRSPNDPQDFSFTAGGGLSPSSFQLDDDADATLSNTRTFADVAAGQRLLGLRDRAQRLGPDERDL